MNKKDLESIFTITAEAAKNERQKIAKMIAERIRNDPLIVIKQIPNGVCYQVEFGPAFGGGETLEEAVENAIQALVDE